MLEELKINDLVNLKAYFYESIEPSLYLEYVERSPDSWYSDSTTDLEIDIEMARKIVSFLQNYLSKSKVWP